MIHMSKTTSKVLIAAAAGLAAGLAIGLLFAPAKGSKTRKKIKKALSDVAEENFPGISEKLDGIRSVFSREGKEGKGTGDTAESAESSSQQV